MSDYEWACWEGQGALGFILNVLQSVVVRLLRVLSTLMIGALTSSGMLVFTRRGIKPTARFAGHHWLGLLTSFQPASDFVAVLGPKLVHCFSADAFPAELKARSIAAVKVHPQYLGSHRGSHLGDIAVVQLKRPVLPSDGAGAAPLCLLPPSEFGNEAPDLIGVGTSAGASAQREAACGLPIRRSFLQINRCREDVEIAKNTTFCAVVVSEEGQLDPSGVASTGSGFVHLRGSLLQNEESHTFYIYGVKSGVDASPPVYTKVPVYTEWIKSVWDRLDIKQATKQNIPVIDDEHQGTDDTRHLSFAEILEKSISRYKILSQKDTGY